MTIYWRDGVLPEWEPRPWELEGEAADRQERGFHERALLSIHWQPIPWGAFPGDGIFGKSKDWLSSVEAAFFASTEDEDLLLSDNAWFGWPDPPR